MKNKVYNFLDKLESSILIAMFTIMILSTFAQVVNRNFIGLSIAWFEELARYCMVYMALIATEMGLRDGSQISITVLTDISKGLTKKLIRIFIKIIIIVFGAVIFITSFQIQRVQIISNQTSPGLHIPMYIPYFALTLNFGIILITQSVQLIMLILNIKKQTKEE